MQMMTREDRWGVAWGLLITVAICFVILTAAGFLR